MTRKTVGLFLLVILISLALGLRSLWALNGAQLAGYGAVQEGMAGAGGSAAPQDNAVMITNPAAITALPRGFRLGFLTGLPKSGLNSSAAPAGNAAAGGMTGNDDPVVLPSGSFVTPIWGERLYLGLGAWGVAAFGNDFPGSRLTPAITGNAYDTHSQYGLLKIVNSLGYKINDQLSVGIALHINRQTFETNGATAATTQTTGIDRTDGSIGAGGAGGGF